eukprot:7385347-Prymnesium_polylepis.1
MSAPLRLQRFRKQFLAEKVRKMVAERPLVGVTYVGNMSTGERRSVQVELDKVGASISYTRNAYASFGMKAAGFECLVPLLRGQTAIIAGPAEVATAAALQSVSKQLPEFT